MFINNAKFAIVHDWFLKNSIGGAEKVTSLIDNFLVKNYSKPDLFSLVSDLEGNIFNERVINTSIIQTFPFGKSKVQNYLPFLPYAIEQLDLREYDLIISSSHAFAKGVITSPNQLHISYVHTPMRYAWDQMNIYLEQIKFSKIGFGIPLRYILYKLREWDFSSSQRVDYLISNSIFTSKRIKKYWGLNSEVINPPVDVKRFKYNQSRDNFYLSVNRLVPNKRIDLLIHAFNNLGLPLIIIGNGSEMAKLRKISKSNISFLGNRSDLEVAEYMSRCRGFVYAGLEDFGIAPIEAMASGAPVIAYGRGGILDTVNCISNPIKDKIANGILFKNQTSADIVDAIKWFEDKKMWRVFNPKLLNHYSQRFNHKNFSNKLELFINKSWEKFKKN